MQNNNKPDVNNYVKNHKNRSIWYRLVTTLAAIVVFATTYKLILPAITMERAPVCGMEEHTHDESCYEVEKTLVCGLDEEPGHMHDDSCFDEEGSLICGMDESEGHTHTDECYEEESVLICGLEEHVHTDECYDTAEEETEEVTEEVIEEETEMTTADVISEETTIFVPVDSDVHKSDSDDDDDEDIPDTVEKNEQSIVVEVTEMAVVEEMTETTTEEQEQEKEKKEKILLAARGNDSPVMLMASDGPTTNEEIELMAVQVSASAVTKYDAAERAVISNVTIDFITDKDKILKEVPDALGVENEPCYEFIFPLPNGVSYSALASLNTMELNKIGDVEVYYYELRDDGTIRFLFRQDKLEELRQKEIEEGAETAFSTGTVRFSVKFGADAFDEEGNIHAEFSDKAVLDISSADIDYSALETVDNDNGIYDIQTEKSAGGFNTTKKTIDYTVTVYSYKGSGGAINIEDAVSVPDGLTLDVNSISVTSFTRNVDQYNTTYSSDQVELGSAGLTYDEATNKITGSLPALGGSEVEYSNNNAVEHIQAYEIKYTCVLDDMEKGTAYVVDNTVTVNVDPLKGDDITDTSTKSTTAEITSEPMVAKTANSDSSGTVTWRIVVGDGETDLKDYKLTDAMLADVDNINIEPAVGASYTSGGTEISFGEDAAKRYVITYQTSFDGYEQSVTNTATLTDGDNGVIGTDGATGYNYRQYFTKENVSVDGGQYYYDNDSETYKAKWRTVIQNTATGIPAGTTFADYSNGEWGNANEMYFTKAEIMAMYNTLSAVTEIGNLKAKDASGNEYTDFSSLPDVKFKGISGEFVSEYAADKDNIVLEYETVIDMSEFSGEKELKNQFRMNNSYTEPSIRVKNIERVVKTDMDGRTYNTSITDTDKTEFDGTLGWQVKVTADKDMPAGSVIDIVDSIPTGLELTDVSVKIGDGSETAIFTDGADAASSADGHAVALTQSGGKATTTLTAGAAIPNETVITVIYKFKISNFAPDDDTYYLLNKTYNNTVSVNVNGTKYGGSSQQQTVTYGEKPPSQIEKSMRWDRASQTMNYKVIINRTGKQYTSDGTGLLDLVDELMYESSASADSEIQMVSYREISLMPETVKLYRATADLQKAEQLDWDWAPSKVTKEDYGEWGAVYNLLITGTVPDATPLILEYSYKVDKFIPNAYDTSLGVTNTLKISGFEDSGYSSDGGQTWQDNSQSGSYNSDNPTFHVLKVAEDNYGNKLNGAVFELYVYNSTADTYTSTGKTYTTGADGEKGIAAVQFGKDSDLKSNTMYYLVEIEAPDGYTLPFEPEKMYFWLEDSKNAERNMPSTIPEGATEISKSPTHTIVNVKNMEADNAVYSVSKVWRDHSGTLIDAPDGASITAVLKRYHADDAVRVNVDYTYKDGVTKTVTGFFKKGSTIKLIAYGNQYDGSLTNTEFDPVLDTNPVKEGKENPVYGGNGGTYTYTFTADHNMDIKATMSTESTYANGIYDFVLTSADGEPEYVYDGVVNTVVLSNGNWTADFDEQPIFAPDGNFVTAYKYIVEEKGTYEGYVAEYDRSDPYNTVVTNKEVDLDEYVKLAVTKNWVNANGDAITPETDSISYSVYKRYIDPASVESNTLTMNVLPSWGDAYTANENCPIGSKVRITFGFYGDSWNNLENYLTQDWFVPEITVTNNGVATVYDKAAIASSWTQDFGSDHSRRYIDLITDGDVSVTGSTGLGGNATFTAEILEVGQGSGGEVSYLTSKVLESTLTADDNWTESHYLPKSGTEGGMKVDYTYYVLEDAVDGYQTVYSIDGHDYTAEEIAEHAIDGGNIIIKNISDSTEESYTLPETGGRGTLPYTLGGISFMIAAILLFIKKQKAAVTK